MYLNLKDLDWWICAKRKFHDVTNVFVELVKLTIGSLQGIQERTSSRPSNASLLSAKRSFIIFFLICENLLNQTLPLSHCFQNPMSDISSAINLP